MQAGEGQSKRLIPTEPTVQSLDASTSRTFHQVVQRGHNHDTMLLNIQFKADIAEVAASQDFWFGIAIDTCTLFDEAHKRLASISLAIDAPQGLLINTLFDKYMRRYQDAAHQFYSGRRERNCLSN